MAWVVVAYDERADQVVESTLFDGSSAAALAEQSARAMRLGHNAQWWVHVAALECSAEASLEQQYPHYFHGAVPSPRQPSSAPRGSSPPAQ